MTPDDRPRFALALASLAVVFDTEVSAERARLYEHALFDLRIETLEKACYQAIRSNKFFPKPVELREHAEAISQLERRQLEWQERLRESWTQRAIEDQRVLTSEPAPPPIPNLMGKLVREMDARLAKQLPPDESRLSDEELADRKEELRTQARRLLDS